MVVLERVAYVLQVLTVVRMGIDEEMPLDVLTNLVNALDFDMHIAEFLSCFFDCRTDFDLFRSRFRAAIFYLLICFSCPNHSAEFAEVAESKFFETAEWRRFSDFSCLFKISFLL